MAVAHPNGGVKEQVAGWGDMDNGCERYEEAYSYEVRDRRVRIARGLQAVD